MESSSAPLTLWALIADGPAVPETALISVEADSGMEPVRETLRHVSSAGYASTVRSALNDGLRGILSTPLDDVIAGAFARYADLLQYCDASRHPPEKINVVPLMSRDVASTLEPSLDVYINGVRVRSIPFEVVVSILIESATLKIQGGRIHEIRLGSCTGKASLACSGKTVLEGKTKTIELPGALTFGSGVPILPESRVAKI